MIIQVTRCLWCGEMLLELDSPKQPRSDKKFCNAKHRASYHRWFKNIKKHEAAALVSIGHLADYLQHPIAQETAVGAMVRLRERVTSELAWAGVKAVR